LARRYLADKDLSISQIAWLSVTRRLGLLREHRGDGRASPQVHYESAKSDKY
jgi:hypothetical protein